MKTYDAIEDHELEGMVYVIPSEYGGRSSAIISGYRGQFFWHINDESCTDWLADSYFERDKVQPGQSSRIKIRLAGTIVELGKSRGMPTGSQFALREGSRIVAVGVITESLYDASD